MEKIKKFLTVSNIFAIIGIAANIVPAVIGFLNKTSSWGIVLICIAFLSWLALLTFLISKAVVIFRKERQLRKEQEQMLQEQERMRQEQERIAFDERLTILEKKAALHEDNFKSLAYRVESVELKQDGKVRLKI